MARTRLGCDVLTAARRRIALALDHSERVSVSFSGGKDSTVMLHLVMEEAIRRSRKVGLLFIDLEGQYRLTIEHVERCFALYADHIEPFWIALPIHLRNAVSVYEPFWLCWEPERRADWVRPQPAQAITDETHWPWFRRGMEFEEFVPHFADWYSQGKPCASFVGIRSDESLNRWRSIASTTKERYRDWSWTTVKGSRGVFNAYPIFDWRAEDIWTFHARNPTLPKNGLYDLMHRAGVPLSQQRICQPYGDDQRRGLWLFHLIEPETWGRVVARVNGANQGALYAQESGNILGVQKVTRPEGHSWQSFAGLLLDSMPGPTAEHYRDKIAVFLKWWSHRGYAAGIPDEADARMEAARRIPSWRRVCKALLRNDYWFKGLSFSQPKSDETSQARYHAIMRKRRTAWGMQNPESWRRECDTGGLSWKPSAEQLALIASLTGGNNPDHAWRALGAALDMSPGRAKRSATRRDASRAIDILRQADDDFRRAS